MTTEEKAALVEFTKKKIESLRFCLKQTAFESVRGHLEPELSMAEIVLAAMTADPVAIPEGWRLVPLEPTVEMINAAQSSTAWDRVDFWEGFYDDKAAYQAMLAAVPTP